MTLSNWIVGVGATMCPYRVIPVGSLFGLCVLVVGVRCITSALAGAKLMFMNTARAILSWNRLVREEMAQEGEVLPWPMSSSST